MRILSFIAVTIAFFFDFAPDFSMNSSSRLFCTGVAVRRKMYFFLSELTNFQPTVLAFLRWCASSTIIRSKSSCLMASAWGDFLAVWIDAMIRSDFPHAALPCALKSLSSEVINSRLNLKNVSSFHYSMSDGGTRIRILLNSPLVISSSMARDTSMVLPRPTSSQSIPLNLPRSFFTEFIWCSKGTIPRERLRASRVSNAGRSDNLCASRFSMKSW